MDWSSCPWISRKICKKKERWSLISIFLKKSKVWLCFFNVLLIKKAFKKCRCLSLACKIFPCRICHIEKIGECSGLLLTRFANKKIYVYVWIPCPGNFYAKFAIEQKMFSRILLQHCPQKIKNQIIFYFMLNFSLEKNNWPNSFQ